jgi:uncharacterized iron-regulated membrane protein
MGFIDFPQPVWFRRALFQVHLWTGVGLGLYVLVISISGSVLVFQQDALDHTQTSASTSGTPLLSFGESVGLACEAHPNNKLLHIDNRKKNRNANIVTLPCLKAKDSCFNLRCWLPPD